MSFAIAAAMAPGSRSGTTIAGASVLYHSTDAAGSRGDQRRRRRQRFEHHVRQAVDVAAVVADRRHDRSMSAAAKHSPTRSCVWLPRNRTRSATPAARARSCSSRASVPSPARASTSVGHARAAHRSDTRTPSCARAAPPPTQSGTRLGDAELSRAAPRGPQRRARSAMRRRRTVRFDSRRIGAERDRALREIVAARGDGAGARETRAAPQTAPGANVSATNTSDPCRLTTSGSRGAASAAVTPPGPPSAHASPSRRSSGPRVVRRATPPPAPAAPRRSRSAQAHVGAHRGGIAEDVERWHGRVPEK